MLRLLFASLALAFAASGLPAFAQEDVAPGAPTFKEGDIISMEQLDKLKPFLPEEFWANRDFFFYEGMQLEIGPAYRDYSEPEPYQQVSKQYAGQSRVGPETTRPASLRTTIESRKTRTPWSKLIRICAGVRCRRSR